MQTWASLWKILVIANVLNHSDLCQGIVGDSPDLEPNGGMYDFTSKLLHLAWHPAANVIACAAFNSLYMYYA